jgi:hypothetical protein
VLVVLGVVDIFMQVVKVVWNKVRQVIVFCAIPTLLDGVQFWRICRKPLEREPIGMVFGKEGGCRSMNTIAIPNQDDPATVMMMQLPQKPNDAVGFHVFPQQLEVMR